MNAVSRVVLNKELNRLHSELYNAQTYRVENLRSSYQPAYKDQVVSQMISVITCGVITCTCISGVTFGSMCGADYLCCHLQSSVYAKGGNISHCFTISRVDPCDVPV